MRDYYRQLGLPHGADLNEIRRAYRELARQCQSSRGNHGVGECLASLHHAYEMLSGQDRRRGSGAERPRWSAGWEAAFADEVDIDFPSVSSVVDRMRESFFGPAPAHPLSAEVRLTPKQADAGVKVPLDVSLRHTCPVCGGRGEVWLDPCGACDGRGAGLLPHQLQLVVPPGVRDGACLRFDVTPSYAPATCVEVRISVQQSRVSEAGHHRCEGSISLAQVRPVPVTRVRRRCAAAGPSCRAASTVHSERAGRAPAGCPSTARVRR